MTELSVQQKAIVNAPLKSMAVVACAGSGKTKTAVQRLSMIREGLDKSRSHAALLSFSNVAVNTFRDAYSEDSNATGPCGSKSRVTIDTFDGFITSNILLPHAYRTMGCKRVPFLLTGTEPFLLNKKFKYWYKSTDNLNRPVEGTAIKDIVVNIVNGKAEFSYRSHNKRLVTNNGTEVTRLLGSLGAYTHELGKLWSLRTLEKQPEILRVLAKKYPYIIIDEAQDLGELHQKILELLITQGVKVALIGDPNQAIYEFAGATGKFITNFNLSLVNQSYELSLNYRSIPEILKVANAISGRADEPDKKSMNEHHGAYYSVYEESDHRHLVDLFDQKVVTSGLSIENSAVLYRNKASIEKLQKISKGTGKGKIKLLALAALQRDANSNFQEAFKLVTSCIVGLLDGAPENLSALILNPSHNSEARDLRLDIWLFVRCTHEGLPHSSLKGGTEWHKLVKDRMLRLLNKIEVKHGYTKAENIGKKLAKTGLIDEPLIPDPELLKGDRLAIRVDTVHQVKGESLDAVLYMATKPHIEAMLGGVNTELGRIGYVAVTRAKKLFILGVPKNSLKALQPKLKAIGIKKLQ